MNKLTDTYKERQKLFDAYQGVTNRNTRRMFLDYNRYHEAAAIASYLKENMHEKLGNLNVLDFGCGVADYGIYFGRAGAVVGLVDIDEETLAFAKHRFAEEDIDLYTPEGHDWDLVIFGEVLEHLENPYDTVNEHVAKGVRYIFTSSYPYRSDDPQDPYWQHDHHTKTALKEQPALRSLLEDHYDRVNFGGQKNLWIKKNLKNL